MPDMSLKSAKGKYRKPFDKFLLYSIQVEKLNLLKVNAVNHLINSYCIAYEWKIDTQQVFTHVYFKTK